MQKFIKNIDHETVVKLTDLVSVQPGQVAHLHRRSPGWRQRSA